MSEATSKKRHFRETSTDEQQVPSKRSNSPESRSPSPALPSRLDRIPSPSSLQENGRSSATSKHDGDEKTNVNRDVIRKSKHKERRERKERSRSKSVERKKSTSPIPKRKRSRSRSPKRKKRSRSRSPKKRKSKSPRRKRSRSRSGGRDKRKRSRSRERHRRSRSRSRDRRRSRSRDRRRPSPRRKRRSSYRSPSPQFTSKWGMKREVSRAVVGDKEKVKAIPLTTEEVEARVAKHMKNVQEKAKEEAKTINLPGYLNPATVNIHQFKQVQDKRKLLWSKTKDKKEGAVAYAGGANDEKFKRLMGIQGIEVEADESQINKSRQVLDDLEKEFDKSRAFQLSRGAGGLTGMGLGFGAFPTQPQ